MSKKSMAGCYVSEGKNPGDVLATAKFRVSGVRGGRTLDYTIKAILVVSGAFNYGNKTCTVLEWSSGREDSYDTRYCDVYPFNEFAKGLVRQEVGSELTIEEVEV